MAPPISRRTFLARAGATTASISLLGGAASAAGASRSRRTVAVFGAGVAGLTAAHELVERGRRAAQNALPLFIQNPGEWAKRPESVTEIPIFFLAGEWVRTNICVTTMDGANRGGRQAANGVLAASGSRAAPAELWPLYVPPEFEPFREIDAKLHAADQPNMFDPDRAVPRSG